MYSDAQLERELSCIIRDSPSYKHAEMPVRKVEETMFIRRKIRGRSQYYHCVHLFKSLLGLHYNRNPEFSTPNSTWAKSNLSQNLLFCFPFC